MVRTRAKNYSNGEEGSGSEDNNERKLKRIVPKFVSPLRARVPPKHSPFHFWYNLNCPTWDDKCVLAGGCTCWSTEIDLRVLGRGLNLKSDEGARCRWYFLNYFEDGTLIPFEQFKALTFDEQHTLIVKRQVEARKYGY